MHSIVVLELHIRSRDIFTLRLKHLNHLINIILLVALRISKLVIVQTRTVAVMGSVR